MKVFDHHHLSPWHGGWWWSRSTGKVKVRRKIFLLAWQPRMRKQKTTRMNTRATHEMEKSTYRGRCSPSEINHRKGRGRLPVRRGLEPARLPVAVRCCCAPGFAARASELAVGRRVAGMVVLSPEKWSSGWTIERERKKSRSRVLFSKNGIGLMAF